MKRTALGSGSFCRIKNRPWRIKANPEREQSHHGGNQDESNERARDIQEAFEEQGSPRQRFVMERDDWNTSNAIDSCFGPESGRQVRNGANIQIVTERNFGRLAHQPRIVGNGQNHFVNELRAGEPVEVGNSSQDLRGQRCVIIQKTHHHGWVERVVLQRAGNRAASRPGTDNEDIAGCSLAEVLVPSSPSHLTPQHQASEAGADRCERGQGLHSVPLRDHDQGHGEECGSHQDR